MRKRIPWHSWLLGVMAISTLAVIACGSSATSTPQPSATPSGSATNTPAPTDNGTPTTPTPAPTFTPRPSDVTSALDNVTLVIDAEPIHLNAIQTGGGLEAAIYRDNMIDTLTWLSGDDLRIVPTSATTGWEQRDEDTWRFFLREGVTFHNGEAWNAEAALPSLEYQGSPTDNSNSFPYTGAFTAEVVDDYTLDINCAQACPILPNTSFFLGFQAPEFFTTASEEELNLKTVGFGPYQLVNWNHGVSVVQEAFEDYVPAGDHFEFQKPLIRTLTWQWRAEPIVMAAMVEQGEADLAWDIGIDISTSANTKTGGSAEMLVFNLNTIWHPELKKKEVRQAISHAINCEDIVDSLYAGKTKCWGNIMFPGVIGATPENVAPYEYNPELARQLLEEADYDDTNSIELIGRAARIPKLPEVYEAVQAYLADVGMNIEINVAEASIRNSYRLCGIGTAVRDVLAAKGEDPDTAQPTREDFMEAIETGPTSGCTPAEMLENLPSNETLDFGRQASYYLNCTYVASFYCDPSPGGTQDKIAEALAATGEDRQQKLAELAQLMHDDVIMLGMFEVPVVYAIDSKLNWEPRFDRRVRASSMWFSP